jgi:acyl-coenzyme A thioesterase 9
MFLIIINSTRANLYFSPVPVAPLIVETEEEKRLFKKGEANYQAKKALRKRSLLERAPDDEESDLIHSMWTKEMSYLSKQAYPSHQ